MKKAFKVINQQDIADVANVIYHYYKNEFVCANIKDNTWYYFNNDMGGKWEETEQGHLLRKKFSNDIVNLYLHYQIKYQKMANELLAEGKDETSFDYQFRNNQIVNISKVIIKLKDSGYKDKIIKECKEYFYDKKFIDNLDSKKHLLGFENGIYDLNTSQFRDGLPDDYVTILWFNITGLIQNLVKSKILLIKAKIWKIMKN